MFLPGDSDTTIRYNTQIARDTKLHKTTHKTTQAIKDTLHKMNTMQIRFTTHK
jgi:hypothetical protein